MTVEQPLTVLDLMTEDPAVRVYQYQHRVTNRVLYAVFPRGQWDDMTEAPDVTEVVLLYDEGAFTAAGQRWYHALGKEPL